MMPMHSQTRLLEATTRGRPKPTFADDSYLAHLEKNSHLPEVCDIIRDGIRRRLIRVLPSKANPGRVRIVRTALVGNAVDPD